MLQSLCVLVQTPDSSDVSALQAFISDGWLSPQNADRVMVLEDLYLQDRARYNDLCFPSLWSEGDHEAHAAFCCMADMEVTAEVAFGHHPTCREILAARACQFIRCDQRLEALGRDGDVATGGILSQELGGFASDCTDVTRRALVERLATLSHSTQGRL